MICDYAAMPQEQVKDGMMLINTLSLPFRGLTVVINGFINLISSTHPVAKAAIEEIGEAIHATWSQSSLANSWTASRIRIIEGFHRDLGILPDETAYFLDSVEELMLAGCTSGIASMAKASLKSAKQFVSYRSVKNKGYPIIKGVTFDRNTATKIRRHRLVPRTPAKGDIECFYVKGSQNSVLIYLDYIQKGRNYVWCVKSCPSYPAYTTSEAGLIAVKEIVKRTGAERVFLQFCPVNPKFHAFFAKYSWVSLEDVILGTASIEPDGPYPVFELSAAIQGINKHIFNIEMPFVVSEMLNDLSKNGQAFYGELYSSFVTPALNLVDGKGKTLNDLSENGQAFYGELYSSFVTPALNLADRKGKTFLHYAIEEQDLPTTRVLVESGAALNKSTLDGYFPLNLAVMKNDPEMVTYLLSKGAPIDQVHSLTGMTALHQVFFYTHPGDTVILENLINAGATLNLLDGVWKTPFLYAIEHQNLAAVKLLLESGVPLANPTPDNYSTNLNYLELAVRKGGREIVFYLIGRYHNQTALGIENLRVFGQNKITDECIRDINLNLCNKNLSRGPALGSNPIWVNNHNRQTTGRNLRKGNVSSRATLESNSAWINNYNYDSNKGTDNRNEIGSSDSNCNLLVTTYGRENEQCYTDRYYDCDSDGHSSIYCSTRDYSSCDTGSGGGNISSSSGDCTIS